MLRSRKISLIAILALCCALLSACYPNGRPFSSLDTPDSAIVRYVSEDGILQVEDAAAIAAFVDMLNSCTYEKFDDDEDTDTVFKQREYYRIIIGDEVVYINDEVDEIYINPLVNSGREGRYKIVDFNQEIFDNFLAAATKSPAEQ